MDVEQQMFGGLIRFYLQALSGLRAKLHVVVSRCRDRSAVLQEEDDEEQEEVMGSLLRGGEDVISNPNEEEQDEGEVETCPPLLSVPPVYPRLQSTLHCINLSIQQVKSGFRTNYCSVSPESENLNTSTCLLVQGTLVGVCGSVGSGKTSLISAVLGQVSCLNFANSFSLHFALSG